MSNDKSYSDGWNGWNEFFKNSKKAKQEARHLGIISEDEYQLLSKKKPHLSVPMTSYYSDNWPGWHQLLLNKSNNKTQK